MTKEAYFEKLSYALRRELLPWPMEEDGLLPVEWNGRILCRVTERGAVRYDPTWVDTDRAKAALAQVAEAAGTVMDYMTLLEAAPPLKAEGLADGYRVLAEFNGTVLAGTETLLWAQFVTWARDNGKKFYTQSPNLDEEPLRQAVLDAVNAVMLDRDTLARQLTTAMERELAPVPGESMSLTDIDHALEELSGRFNSLLAEASANPSEDYTERFRPEYFPEGRELTKEDVVIIGGDFGGVWFGDSQDDEALNWLESMPFTVAFVSGNHENYDALARSPVELWHGGRVQTIRPYVLHLMRRQVYELAGLTFFTIGGASTHDIENGVLSLDDPNFKRKYWMLQRKERARFRIDRLSWWREELPSAGEYAEARKNLDPHGWAVDYILTHCAPTSIALQFSRHYAADRLTDFLQEVKDRAQYHYWRFGHYHDNKAIDTKHILLWEQIVQIPGVTPSFHLSGYQFCKLLFSGTPFNSASLDLRLTFSIRNVSHPGWGMVAIHPR